MGRQIQILTFCLFWGSALIAQDQEMIEAYESQEPVKVFHAEPLYIDLIRDLGARKGEAEWNAGFGINDNTDFDSYDFLVEYEWAVIDRLGLEIETNFEFYSGDAENTPANKLEGLQLATQWSFFVSEEMSTSLALGYLNLFEFSDFDSFGDPLISGNVYNPFLVAAKRWGSHFHTLIYTGPQFEQHFSDNSWDNSFEINTNFHWMIPNTTNFIGLEINKTIEEDDFLMVFRPQMRVEVTHDILIGLVGGVPIIKDEERLSLFLRLIWEP